MGESQVMQDSVDRLRLNAIKCRDLASTAVTSAAREILDGLAQQYEQKATRLERSDAAHPRRPAFKWTLE